MGYLRNKGCYEGSTRAYYRAVLLHHVGVSENWGYLILGSLQ